MPEPTIFATKPKLGRALLERAFAADVPCAWVAGDSIYGVDSTLRRFIETTRRGYVLAVTSAQRLGLKPVEDWLEDVPAEAWQRLSAGDGAKGPRFYDWAYLPDRSDTAPAAPGWKKGLLIRRKLAKPDKITFYLTLSPEATALSDLVRVAGTRWTIEACFEAAKGEVGLDQYEVRSWTGWHRHVTLAMLAHAYLTVLRRRAAAAASVASGGGDGSRCRSHGRLAAPHRTRTAPSPLASHLAAPAGSRGRSRLVMLAPTTPAARTPVPLDATDERR